MGTPTRTEERLTEALHAEAATYAVDPTRLRDDLARRLVGPTTPGTGRPRTVLVPLLVAAAVVVAIGIGVALRATGPGRETPVGPSREGGTVYRTFSCPAQAPVALDGSQDEFVPDLQRLGGPRGVAAEYDAPRWAFESTGARAELRLGNRDKTLGSTSHYRREGGEWRLTDSRACTAAGGDTTAGTADQLTLGLHDHNPWAPRGLLRPDGRTTPVLVDDRAVYDYSGLTRRHRTLWASRCGDDVCLRSGVPGSVVKDRLRPGPAGTAQDLTEVFLLPDDLVGRTNPYRLLALWDPTGARKAPVAVRADGTRARADRFRDASWGPGVLWLVLSLADDPATTTGPAARD